MRRFRSVPAAGIARAGLAAALLAMTAYGCGDADRSGAEAPEPAGEAVAADRQAADGTPDEDLESICAGIRNSFECARAIERDQLPGDGRASRSGDTLFLALGSGDTLRLVDRTARPAEVERHSYQRRWREAGYFIVHRQYYEGSAYLVIDDGRGAITEVPARPLLSPDRRRFAVLSLDLVAGYAPNALQIWQLTGSGPRLEWETRPREWGAENGRWLGPERLRYTRACAPTAIAEAPCGEVEELVHGETGWSIRAVDAGGGTGAGTGAGAGRDPAGVAVATDG